MSLGKRKLTRQSDTATHLSEWPKFRTRKHPKLVRMWGIGNSHPSRVGVPNGTAPLEGSLVLSYKTQHNFTARPSEDATWHLPRRAEKAGLHETCSRGQRLHS